MAGKEGAQIADATQLRMLPLNEMKQQFSLAFVHMVASAAGCSIKHHGSDYDGVDITIASSADYATHYGPQIELQVKCTARVNLLTDSAIRWKLDARTFYLLTDPRSYVARFLAVLLVPGKPSDWLDQDKEILLTRSCMYWGGPSELGTLKEGQQSKVVHLPRSNILNVTQLQSIMKSIGDGGES